jgi:hypothetical protein
MKFIDKVLGSELAPAWRRAAAAFSVALVLAFVFTWAAALRVASVDPTVARFAPDAGAVLKPVIALAGGLLAITLVILIVRRYLDLLRRRPAFDGKQAGTLALLAVGLAGVHLAPRFLTMPLSGRGGPASIPLLSLDADRYLWALTTLLAVEMVLALAAMILGRNSLWWRARFVVGVSWCALLAWIITGPNLLQGDPLEWAAALGGASIPQSWLVRAPRAVESWWPALQIVLAATLLSVILSIVNDLATIVKAFRNTGATTKTPRSEQRRET